MKAILVLKDSLAFLKRQPLFFVPGLLSTTVWNIFLVYFIIQFGLNLYSLKPPERFDALPLYVAGFFMVFLVSLLLHSMYPTLVKSYRQSKRLDFSEALSVALNRLPRVFLAVLTPALLVAVPASLATAVAVLGYRLNVLPLVVLGVVMAFVIVFVIAVRFYFAPSSIVIHNLRVSESFGKSFELSRKYRRDVTVAVLLFFALLALAFLLPGLVRVASLGVFVAIQYASSLISAYLSVVSPNLYLELQKR